MPLFTGLGTPQLNQPVLLATNVNGRWEVVLDTWKGNMPSGFRFTTPQEAKQLVQQNISTLQGDIARGKAGGWQDNNPSIQRINQEIAQLQQKANDVSSLSGQYDPSKLGGFKYTTDPETGNLITEQSLKEKQSLQAKVDSGEYVEIAPGKYVPTGSAGDPNSPIHNAVPVSGEYNAQGNLVVTQPAASSTAGAVEQPQTTTSVAPTTAITQPATTQGNTTAQYQLNPDGKTYTQITPEQSQQAYQQSGIPELVQQAGLTPDQEKAIESVYQATLANDQSYADRIAAAMQAASEYSEPYFKAQIALVSDSLTRALTASEGDLQFNESQLQNALSNLEQDIAASKDYTSFQHTQELQGLARRYEQNLESTQNQMAATGFTTSTRRSRAERLLREDYEGAVESSNRSLSYQTGGLNRNQAYQQQDTAAQIANLQRLASQGRLDLLRQTEEQIGSENLGALGYVGEDVLGGVGGTIPRQQAQDQLAFAGSYIF